MEFGGDDQWINTLGGTELIRRKPGKDALTPHHHADHQGGEDDEDRATPSGLTK